MVQEVDFWTRLYAEVRELRDSLPNDVAAKHRGGAILGRPPAPGELLVIGLHPRCEPGERGAELDYGPPSRPSEPNDPSRPPSQRIDRLVAAADLDERATRAMRDALARASESYLWFFGAGGAPEWNSSEFWGQRGETLRSAVEAACLDWHERILSVLRPAGLLCVGLAIHGNLAARWGDQLRERAVIPRPEGDGRLAVEADIAIAGQTVPFLATRQSRDDWASAPEERTELGAALARFSARAGVR
ncbi:MAG: hypothetical protein WD382_10805 [Halofilum sp. (in: g-proteobacteria)]